MINILPERGRATARLVYRLRLVAVIFLVLATVCLIAAGLLSPSYFRALAEESAARAESVALSGEDAKSKETEEPLAATMMYLEAYAPHVSATSVGDRIALVLTARPAGITFTRFSYEKANDAVKVSGIASTRETLLLLERSLKTLPNVASVELPVGDLARSSQAPFSVSVRFSPAQP